jgi:hypothetical protein
MPVIAQASNDPILALIDRHKVAFAEWIEAVNHLSDMEAAIPSELQKGGAYCFEVEIVKTDDPRWTAANIRYNDIIIKADGIAIEARRHTNVAGRLGSNPEMCSPARPKTALWPDGSKSRMRTKKLSPVIIATGISICRVIWTRPYKKWQPETIGTMPPGSRRRVFLWSLSRAATR